MIRSEKQASKIDNKNESEKWYWFFCYENLYQSIYFSVLNYQPVINRFGKVYSL